VQFAHCAVCNQKLGGTEIEENHQVCNTDLPTGLACDNLLFHVDILEVSKVDVVPVGLGVLIRIATATQRHHQVHGGLELDEILANRLHRKNVILVNLNVDVKS
jgi:hypothetical protein